MPPAHAQAALASSGEPLDERVRGDFEPRFGHDFSRVRIHTNDRAAQSAGALHARAYTFGRDIVFGPGRYEPASSTGRLLIAHELAHVVQQGRAGRPALQLDSELDSLPENERTRIRVQMDWLSETMQKDVDRAFLDRKEVELPSGMTVRFGGSIGEADQEGLKAVVSLLIDGEADEEPALPANTSLTLAISSAKEVYRFTRVERPSTKLPGAKTPVPEVVVVEKTGAIEAAPKAPKAVWDAFPGPLSTAQGPLPAREAGPMRDCLARGADLDSCQKIVLGKGASESTLAEKELEVRKVKLKRGPGWKESDWATLSAALETIPEAVLKQAEGAVFLREAEKVCSAAEVKAGTCDPGIDAETSPNTKKMRFFDNAFHKSTTRHGTATALETILIHEIGHLADFSALSDASRVFMAGARGAGELKKYLDARALSGTAWDKPVFAKDGFHIDSIDYKETGGAPAGSFREAAIQDGLKVKDDSKQIVSGGISLHGGSSWAELFAECYALYFTDPDLLAAIRPAVFKYFETAFPKK